MLVASQRQSRILSSENTILGNRTSEALEQLEMAALDREVAEEKAEAADTEVGKLGDRISGLELDIAVLREENGRLAQQCDRSDRRVAEFDKPNEASEGERSSLAFIQLEKHNERLKEALIRLARLD